MRSLPWKVLVLVAALLFAANVFIWRAALAPRALTVRVFETGKGRAILATTPSGKTLLIDSGSDASILRALGSALPPWRRTLDVVIPIKAGAGLAEVKNRYRITKTLSTITRGTRITLDRSTFIDVLWPAPNVPDAPVLLLSYGATSFLIEPVTTPHIEKYLTSADADLPPSDAVIASNTPGEVLVSDGVSVRTN